MPKENPRKITIFGSTGSIGINTLDVIQQLGLNTSYNVETITGHSNVELLAKQAREFNVENVVIGNEVHFTKLKDLLSDTKIKVHAGEEALVNAGAQASDMVMGAIVGLAGLAPTLSAARNGADIALANKECLVSAGDLFISEIEKNGGTLLPVDSEHNAIFQVLERKQQHAVERIILTASGGPFRDWPIEKMAQVTPRIAAAHPNWAMGLKISIDSASMFNKALEMIEAKHLFSLKPEQIEVIVHPQSIIHSMVGYCDGSILAQLGAPDMRTAIGYALSYPQRHPLNVERLDFAKISRLDFQEPDAVRFPALRLARQAMKEGKLQGAVLNGAKEIALEAFIKEEIGFLEMAPHVEETMNELQSTNKNITIDDVFDADKTARRVTSERIRRQKKSYQAL